MRISDAVAEERDIVVPFKTAELKVTYRPMTYTVRQIEEIQEQAKRAGDAAASRIIFSVKEMVVAWDLEDENGVVPLDHPLIDVTEERPSETVEGEVEQVPTGEKAVADDDPLRDVPTHIFGAIMKAIGEDQTPSGEASRRSRGR